MPDRSPNNPFADRYQMRWTTPQPPRDGVASAEDSGLVVAMNLGFHVPRPTPTAIASTVSRWGEDRVEFLRVDRRDPQPASLDAAAPVGTFGVMPKALSWGGGANIDTLAVFGVTVRATERRRGMLREMMTTALHKAIDDGYAAASLNASEGTIYRRFGFGPATRTRTISVKRDRALPLLVKTTGEVVTVEPGSLIDGTGRRVFDRFHAQSLGSMARGDSSWTRTFGLRGSDDEPDMRLMAAVHRPAAGVDPDGYVTYRFVNTDEHGSDIEVGDLVYTDDASYLALWEFLLSVDLVRSVTYRAARVPDPIIHVVADNRAVHIDAEEDHVWLRVLDPVALLSSRPYAADGSVRLVVDDAMGFASGTFDLTVERGRGTVRRVSGSRIPETTRVAALDAATLGGLLLGSVDAVELEAVGLISGAEAAATLAAMLRPLRTPHGITSF